MSACGRSTCILCGSHRLPAAVIAAAKRIPGVCENVRMMKACEMRCHLKCLAAAEKRYRPAQTSPAARVHGEYPALAQSRQTSQPAAAAKRGRLIAPHLISGL